MTNERRPSSVIVTRNRVGSPGCRSEVGKTFRRDGDSDRAPTRRFSYAVDGLAPVAGANKYSRYDTK